MSLIYTYEIRSKVTNKVYYGSSVNPKQRFYSYRNDWSEHNEQLSIILSQEHTKKIIGVSTDRRLEDYYISNFPCVNKNQVFSKDEYLCECGVKIKKSKRNFKRHQSRKIHKKNMEELNAFCLTNISLDIFK